MYRSEFHFLIILEEPEDSIDPLLSLFLGVNFNNCNKNSEDFLVYSLNRINLNHTRISGASKHSGQSRMVISRALK